MLNQFKSPLLLASCCITSAPVVDNMITNRMKDRSRVTFEHFIIALNGAATTNCQTGRYFKMVISWTDVQMDGPHTQRDVYRNQTPLPDVQTGPVLRQDERNHKYSTMLVLITDWIRGQRTRNR